MNILFTGNIRPISVNFFKKVSEDNTCVVFEDYSNEGHLLADKQNKEEEPRNLEKIRKLKNVKVFTTETEQTLTDLYVAYSFDMVVYVSKAIDGAIRIYDDLEMLEENMYLCRHNNIKNFVLITSNDVMAPIVQETERSRNRRLLNMTGERLASIGASKGEMHTQILRVPHMYSTEENGWQLEKWIHSAVRTKKISFTGYRDENTDFLNDEDLGVLVARIADLPPDVNYLEMNLGGGNIESLNDLVNCIKKNIPGVTGTFKNFVVGQPIAYGDNTAKKEYGWYPTHDLRKELPDIISAVKNDILNLSKKKKRMRNLKRIGEVTRVTAEIAVLAVITEWLNHLVKGNSLLEFMDFRLLAVLIVGTMDGLMPGLISALIASFGYLFSLLDTVSWQLLITNIQNWLPFAAYFLLGSVTGYGRDKMNDKLKNATEETEVMEKKYVFLNLLYHDVLKTAEHYNNQIIGYKDSYGKIYSAVKGLEKLSTEEVLYEAVQVLEKMLGSESIGIYSCEKDSWMARLEVCSKNENERMKKSIDLRNYMEFMDEMEKNETFINRDCLPDYPAYAAPIYDGENLYGIVIIKEADESQLSIEFSNKFTIISKLISSSITNAIKETTRADRFVRGTKVLNSENFAKLVDIRKKMFEKNFADYTLIKIKDQGEAINEIEKKIEKVTRNNDVLGIGKNNELYLLLVQTGNVGAEKVAGRLTEIGQQFEIVKDY